MYACIFGLGKSNGYEFTAIVEQRRRRDKKEAADLRAYLVLVPLIACLFSVLLSMESHAFECAFVQLGPSVRSRRREGANYGADASRFWMGDRLFRRARRLHVGCRDILCPPMDRIEVA